MNWGKGIAIAIIAFMLFIVSFVYRAFQKDAELVMDDYYEQEVNYDVNKESRRNYEALDGEVSVFKNEDGIYIQFPEEVDAGVSGTIKFYRPDGKKFDRSYDLKLNTEKTQILSYDEFVEGGYDVTVEWEANDKTYRFEDHIIF